MTIYTLENQEIAINVNSLGAELQSLTDIKTKQEYMWDARPEFWKRTSPILFPIVGSLKDKTYSYQGKSYQISQHGFARDMDFHLKSKTDNQLTFCLRDTETTRAIYPFSFEMDITYTLNGREVTVGWKVTNKNIQTMYFSIGGHPAFSCPWNNAQYYIQMDASEIACTALNNGLAVADKYNLTLEGNLLPISTELFSHDALVIEQNQAHEVSLLSPDKTPYLTVKFDAPLFGIWSPVGKQAPFVCIEPWYGRCDAEDFDGTLEEREWGNELLPSESFFAQYSILI